MNKCRLCSGGESDMNGQCMVGIQVKVQQYSVSTEEATTWSQAGVTAAVIRV